MNYAITPEEWEAKLTEHGAWVLERKNELEKRKGLTMESAPPVKSCFHEWKEYDGFRERYFFCTKCDTKKESLDEVRDDAKKSTL